MTFDLNKEASPRFIELAMWFMYFMGTLTGYALGLLIR